jgi:integrase
MAKIKPSLGKHLRRKTKTKMLWFRYYWPKDIGGGMREFSLRTTDVGIAQHRANFHAIECVMQVEELRAQASASSERRPMTTLDYAYRPGEHVLEDGTCIHAEEDWYYMTQPGQPMRHARNRVRRVVEGEGMTLAEYIHRVSTDTLHEDEIDGEDCPGWRGEPIELCTDWEPGRVPADGGIIASTRPEKIKVRKKVRACADDKYLDIYLKQQNITGYYEAEARRSWADFRMITDGKPLKDCDRADGRKLVDHYFAKGNKRATVQKKIMYLNAMTNLAMDEPNPTIKFNPFSKIIPKIKDAVKREPMSEEDMAIVRKNLDTLKPEEKLLWMLCATTGMRRGEALSIEREYNEKGFRYVIVGTKSDAAHRRVPLPDAVLPLLPRAIKGPIFEEKWLTDLGQKNLGRNLLLAVRRLGVKGTMRDIHALRHRAKDQLRAAECPPDMLDWICGHDKRTVSVNYGKGPPVRLMKRWIEEIGY